MLEPQFQELLSFNDPLSHWRKKSWDRFRDLGSLDTKKEAFQYVSLQDLVLPRAAKKLPFEKVPSSNYPSRIVFVDGFFSLEHSLFPETVVCLPLDEALRSYGVFLQNRMTKTIKEEEDPFAALNGAFQGEGAFLYIPPKTVLEHPIHVEYFFTGSEMTTPRLMLYLGKQSKLQVLQHWHTEIEEPSFANAHIDAALDEGADLSFKTVHRQAPKTHLFQALRATLKRDSRFTAHLYSEGAKMTRHSMKVQLLEENAQALLQGLTHLDGQNQGHIHALVEHLAPNTRSRQHFKAMLQKNSVSSFEGKIYVHAVAQKTESYQLSNNLLLSDEAFAYAKPNLEIFADDVKASHGATVSQLDEEALFYLCSRGVPKEEAKQCLIRSFIQELEGCLPER